MINFSKNHSYIGSALLQADTMMKKTRKGKNMAKGLFTQVERKHQVGESQARI